MTHNGDLTAAQALTRIKQFNTVSVFVLPQNMMAK